MQQRPNLPLSLVLAGRGFVMGVCLGLSGIVLDPIRGICTVVPDKRRCPST